MEHFLYNTGEFEFLKILCPHKFFSESVKGQDQEAEKEEDDLDQEVGVEIATEAGAGAPDHAVPSVAAVQDLEVEKEVTGLDRVAKTDVLIVRVANIAEIRIRRARHPKMDSNRRRKRRSHKVRR